MSGTEIFRIKGNPCEFRALPKPIEKVGRKKDIRLNGKYFPACALSRGFHRLKDVPLAIYGAELEGGEVTPESILAFDVRGVDKPTRAVMLKCFENPDKLLAAIRRQLSKFSLS